MSAGFNHRVDGARLIAALAALAEIGATPDGGCRRLALTDEDKAGRDWLAARMRGLGMEVRIDAVGNMVGLLKGVEDGPAVVLGSHIDTVGSGGRYDGALGVLAGLEVVATLKERGAPLKRDLAVIAFSNEEGARFQPDMMGSCVWAGAESVAAMAAARDANGASFGDELRRIGYDGAEAPGFLKAHRYFELHIEQGPVLEREGVEIGAVTGVQGITWLELDIAGEPRHGGTTPMEYRRDAGLLAARINVFAREATLRRPGLLANMGAIRVEPGEVNVVPARVVCTLDLRHPDGAALDAGEREIRAFAERAAQEAGLGLAIRDLARFAPTPFDPAAVARVEAAAAGLGLSCRRIVSGAGHDAQLVARLCPTAMIFVPSIGGVSHNPAERTADADLVNGANVLLAVTLEAVEA